MEEVGELVLEESLGQTIDLDCGRQLSQCLACVDDRAEDLE